MSAAKYNHRLAVILSIPVLEECLRVSLRLRLMDSIAAHLHRNDARILIAIIRGMRSLEDTI